uniref:Phosphatidylinositol 4-phosphate 3-kinase C2 domain-containing subunit alpha n=1 Tax=Leptobrachium leishanense TaxID=445787 RepID=A0A8C5QNM3_9ANUR
MAQVSSSNGLRQKVSPPSTSSKDVDKEEALQMEAEALAKLHKDRSVVGRPSNIFLQMQQKTAATSISDSDLMVFPESDARAATAGQRTDFDKLTPAELEKLLLDENFECCKPLKPLAVPPVPNPSVSTQYYLSPSFQTSQWSAGMQGHVSCTLPPNVSIHFPKCPDPFQNGLNPNMSARSREPVYLGIPAQVPFVSFPSTANMASFHLTRSLPTFSNAVSPDMAILLDKVARTSEFLKNGKAGHGKDSLPAGTAACHMQTNEKLEDISKFDWLDLDPLSKPKVDSMELSSTSLEAVVPLSAAGADDPWDAVLLEETPVNSAQFDQKCHLKSHSGATVIRSHSLNFRTTNSQLPRSRALETDNGTSARTSGNTVWQELEAENEEVASFCEEVTKLRKRNLSHDFLTNPGFIMSPVMPQRNIRGELTSVKVSIEIEGFQLPVTFTCDVSSPVELIIMQALCWVHDDLNKVDMESYVLRVCGHEEVLQNKHCLGSHEYIQMCRKWDSEIKLQLLSFTTICRDLARTGNQYSVVVHVIKAVQNLCKAADSVETHEITDCVKRLRRTVNLPRNKVSPQTGGSSDSSDDPASRDYPLQESLSSLTTAVHNLLQLHLELCGTAGSLRVTSDCRVNKEAGATSDHLQFTVFAAHGIPTTWVSSFEKYFLVCSLVHNGKDTFKPIQSKKVGTYKSFFYLVKWDELIIFPIQISQMPLESILQLRLYGILNPNSGGSPDSNKQRKLPELLGQVSVPLFSFKRLLTRGTKLLNLWTSFPTSSAPGTIGRKSHLMQKIVLQVDFPLHTFDIVYCAPKSSTASGRHNMDGLDGEAKSRLLALLTKDATLGLQKEEKTFLWEKRHYCHSYKDTLPKILASAPSWDVAYLSDIYSLIREWPALHPVIAMELLSVRFSDQEVRSLAVKWIDEALSDDELADFLPQFVQALRYEIYLDSALVRFLLSRALGNIRIAHYFYWLLKEPLNDLYLGKRYEQVLGALLSMCGKNLRTELEKQTRLTQVLGVVAEKVRQASGSARQVALQEGMERVQLLFRKCKCRLPLNPSLVVQELNPKVCSFFNSNALPLKITLVNADPHGEEINSMFKVGEDLRQDMLALQMIKIMDKLWLQEGLDLRMVLFKCLSTGKDQGMVELVPSSDTLRKIQVEYGVTGSFKDKPLADWLRKYNPSEEEYEKASENFLYSCAGCCVATYVLGICDRHNDNIMLRSTGHMFHIDFGKFLGHAQMFGSFKRDRTPFVLTSDMAYVINGGEKPTCRFQLFVDLCCQAYNLLRKHSQLILNLLSLMISSGLPELTGIQDLKYVVDALQMQATDAEATIFFTRLIESSLGSVATKFNFFIHNLAQRFSGLPASDEAMLSFSPKTYSLKQDGRIREASVFTYHKRYNPDKYYIYVVRVIRDGQDESSFIFRTFDEFQELHNKLGILFPLWKLPGFPSKVVLGRTHIKEVAARRKLELNSYIQSLLSSSADVSECDIVYTFFHPLLRDEKGKGIVKAIEEPPLSPSSGKIEGEVKLSISYRNGTLFVMVMHIKDLVTEDNTDPNPYVKTYLLPDPHKTSKRKTKTARKTCNPTFNEMLVYSGYNKEMLRQKALQLSVLSAESLRENFFLGGITLPLRDFNLRQETVKWYKLTEVPYFS